MWPKQASNRLDFADAEFVYRSEYPNDLVLWGICAATFTKPRVARPVSDNELAISVAAVDEALTISE